MCYNLLIVVVLKIIAKGFGKVEEIGTTRWVATGAMIR
jgi:hypothetical protein